MTSTTEPTTAAPNIEGDDRLDQRRWALGVIDVENDFCEGGSLAVDGGAETARRIRTWIEDAPDRWVARFATADRHPPVLAGHFAEEGQDPDYRSTWPAHCVAGTPGAELHPNLVRDAHESTLFDVLVEKGQTSAAYSGFEGTTPDGDTLTNWLRARAVDGVELTGIATDHCVQATAHHALDAGFAVRIVLDLCAGIDETAVAKALDALRERGAEVVTTTELAAR
ncbi:MAG: isochorismatase family protein [Aquihabitans sp.]